MSTSWNGQICNGEGKYYIQFETDNKELYRLVEKACQNTMDIAYPLGYDYCVNHCKNYINCVNIIKNKSNCIIKCIHFGALKNKIKEADNK